MENKHTKSQIPRYPLGLISLFLTLLILFSSCATAQNYSSSSKKAIKLFEEAQGNYQNYKLGVAETLLKEALSKDANFVEAQTLLSYVLIDKGEYSEAEKSFRRAIEIDEQKIPNNLFFLAQLVLNDGKYNEAKALFNKFLKNEKINDEMRQRSLDALEKIDYALNAIANPVKFEPINLGNGINSEYSEYFPSLTVDESTILFTRRLPSPESPQGFNEDFYVAHKKGKEWDLAYNINKPINTQFNEGAPSLSADGQLLIFTACELYGNYGGDRKGLGSCDLFYSQKQGNNWSVPYNLGQTINSKHWETQPSFSADGKTLYFIRGIRDRSGNRNGNIYVSELNSDLMWSTPTPLGNTINTPLNEESVFIHPDGKTLYFSSDGHPGMGGLDIFITRKNEEGEWSEPINLGYPINTFRNENSLLVAPDGITAYFASDREGGFGELDLYKFELDPQFRPNAVSYFAGKIYDAESKKTLGARFELIDLATANIAVESYSDPVNGEFLVTLPAGKDYALNVSKEGYLFYSENFALEASSANEPRKEDIPLNPIKVGKKIILKNIFFETAKYDLKDKSKVELDKLIDFLNENPSLKIKVLGHTDNVGSDASNQLLSKNRAKSVSDYLIANGIEANRMQSEGYGSSQPVADNSTEEGRAKNRRTEFEIMGM